MQAMPSSFPKGDVPSVSLLADEQDPIVLKCRLAGMGSNGLRTTLGRYNYFAALFLFGVGQKIFSGYTGEIPR